MVSKGGTDSIVSCTKSIRHNDFLITFIYFIPPLHYRPFLQTAIIPYMGDNGSKLQPTVHLIANKRQTLTAYTSLQFNRKFPLTHTVSLRNGCCNVHIFFCTHVSPFSRSGAMAWKIKLSGF